MLKIQASFLQESETENTYSLISCQQKCQKCFPQLTGLSSIAAHLKGREMKGKEGKWEEMNGISHLPAEIKWGSVCSRQHVCVHTEGSQNIRVLVPVCLGVTSGDGSVERHRDRQTHDQADRKIDRGTNDWSGWKLFGQAYTTCSLQNNYWYSSGRHMGHAKIQRPDTVKMSIMEEFSVAFCL